MYQEGPVKEHSVKGIYCLGFYILYPVLTIENWLLLSVSNSLIEDLLLTHAPLLGLFRYMRISMCIYRFFEIYIPGIPEKVLIGLAWVKLYSQVAISVAMTKQSSSMAC